MATLKSADRGTRHSVDAITLADIAERLSQRAIDALNFIPAAARRARGH